MTSSVLGSVLCLALVACVAPETTPDSEGQAPEEATLEQSSTFNVYWYCENAGPEACVVLAGWLPRNECVLACQAVGIAVPKCRLIVEPACAF